MGYRKQVVFGLFAATLAMAAAGGVEWNEKAGRLYRQGRYAEAEAMYRRALESFGRDQHSLNRALTQVNLAAMLRAQARYAEGEALLREALPEIEAATGNGSVETGRAVSNLAALYWSWGRLEDAERLAQRASAIFEAVGTKTEQAGNRQILASVYLAEHRIDEAEGILQPEAGLGETLQAVTNYSNLSVAAMARRDNARAEEYARKALELADRVLPARHPLRAVALNNLAQACRFQGKYLEAEGRYREAIAIWQDALGAQHPDVARGMMNHAAFYHERGREAGAEDLYLRASQILEHAFGKRDAQVLVARNERADVLRAEGRFTEAERLARATLAEMEGIFRADDPRLERARQNYALLEEERNPNKRRPPVGSQTLRPAGGRN